MAQEKQRKEHQAKYDKWWRAASMAWAWRLVNSLFHRRSIENAQADEKFNEMLKKERAGGQTKPCPKCKQPLTKNGGCDHMTCPCGYEFYWSSGKPYGKFAAGGGGGFFGGWMGGGGGADY